MNRRDIINNEKTKLASKRTNAIIKSNNMLKNLMLDKTYADYEIEKRKLIVELTKTELGSKQEKDLRKQLETVVKKQDDRLKTLGVKKEDISPKFECKKCNDMGYVGTQMCECLKKNIQSRLLEESGLKNVVLHSFSESDKNILAQNETLQKAHKIGIEFANNFPQNKFKNLVFVGNVGKGKTFLAECIANQVMRNGFYVVYVTSFELNNLVVKTMDLFSENREEILSPLLECDLLIIDDLGTEPVYKKFSIDNLYTIINQRQLHNLSTIISTNLSPQMIRDNYGDRLFSRIFNKQNTIAILFDGKDLRINK